MRFFLENEDLFFQIPTGGIIGDHNCLAITPMQGYPTATLDQRQITSGNRAISQDRQPKLNLLKFQCEIDKETLPKSITLAARVW